MATSIEVGGDNSFAGFCISMSSRAFERREIFFSREVNIARDEHDFSAISKPFAGVCTVTHIWNLSTRQAKDNASKLVLSESKVRCPSSGVRV